MMKVVLPPAWQRSMALIQAEFYYSSVAYLTYKKLILVQPTQKMCCIKVLVDFLCFLSVFAANKYDFKHGVNDFSATTDGIM